MQKLLGEEIDNVIIIVLVKTNDFINNFSSGTLIDKKVEKYFSKAEISSEYWIDIYHDWVATLSNSPAVYLFCVNNSTELIYTGMAGKIKNNGTFSNWSIANRLKAFRGKSYDNLNITTGDFIRQIVLNGELNIKSYKGVIFENINTFHVHVLYPQRDVLPGFIEASILYDYYKEFKRLPKLNLTF